MFNRHIWLFHLLQPEGWNILFETFLEDILSHLVYSLDCILAWCFSIKTLQRNRANIEKKLSDQQAALDQQRREELQSKVQENVLEIQVTNFLIQKTKPNKKIVCYELYWCYYLIIDISGYKGWARNKIGRSSEAAEAGGTGLPELPS